MGREFGGILGLIILIADIWAIVETLKSSATTGRTGQWMTRRSSLDKTLWKQ